MKLRGRLAAGEYQALTYLSPSKSIGGRLVLPGDDDIQGVFARNPGLEEARLTGRDSD